MLKYVSNTLKNDKEVVLEIVKQNVNELLYLSSDLKNDIEIVLAAVKQNGSALDYASETLKNDKDVVLAAVKQSGSTLQYASQNPQEDKELIKESLINIPFDQKLISSVNYFILNDMIPLILEKDYKYIKNVILESKNLKIENEKNLFEKIIKKYPQHLNKILYYIYLNYIY